MRVPIAGGSSLNAVRVGCLQTVLAVFRLHQGPNDYGDVSGLF